MKKPEPNKKSRPRKRAGATALTLRDRDRLILHLIYKHRFMDMELLSAFVTDNPENAEQAIGADGKRRPRKYGFGEKALYKRLRQLAEAKYIKPHQAMARPIGRGFGGARIAYGLGRASVEVVAREEGLTIAQVRELVKADKVKPKFIEHALAIARFRVILELACEQSGGRVRLLFWEQGDMLRDSVAGKNWNGERRKFSVDPDAFFGLEVAGKGKAHCFLEMDWGTMPIVRSEEGTEIRKKVFAFAYYRKYNLPAERYQYRVLPDGTVVGVDRRTVPPDKDDPNRIKYFRVLFVAKGATRGKLTERSRVANILSAFPSFGKDLATSTLFWFTSLDSFDIHQPSTIFDNVWLTPNPTKGLTSLVE
jgi:hypothetical protein